MPATICNMKQNNTRGMNNKGKVVKNKPGPWDDIARGVGSAVKTVTDLNNKQAEIVRSLTGAKAIETAVKKPTPKNIVKAVVDVGSAAIGSSAKGLSQVAGSSIAKGFGSRVGSDVQQFSARGVTSATKGASGLLKIASNEGARATRAAANVVRPAATGVARAGIVAGVAATKKSNAPKNKSKTNKR